MKYIRAFLLFTVLVSGGFWWEGREEPPPRRPNFLFIAVDDLNIYNTVLGNFPGNFLEKIYPDDRLRESVINRLTPRMNAFAKEAVVFEKAYCAAPLCGPSRTALLTGVPPHVSGYYHHDQHFRGYETLTDAVTLPQYLKQNGYYTCGIGKVFHKGQSYLDRGVFSDWPDQLFSWDDWVETWTGTGAGAGASVDWEEKISRYWENKTGNVRNYTRFGTTEVPREKANDFLNAKFIADLVLSGQAEMVDFRKQKKQVEVPKGKPWFLACGLFAPHLPWVVPQSFHDLFPVSEMSIDQELLDWINEDQQDLSGYGKEVTRKTGFTRLRQYGIKVDGEGGDLNAWKAYLQAYLATVAYSDQNIGFLIDALKKSPGKDNTVVLLWSDHGYHIGDKNRTGKTTLWEGANHSNLIARDYRNTNTGTLQTPVSLQDLYPTVVSLAGLPRPDHIYGYDLSKMLTLETSNRGPVLNTHGKDNHAIRVDQYRFIRFRNGDRELYDLEKDPFEFENLIGKEVYVSVANEMEQLLDQELSRTPNQFPQ